MFDLAEGLIRRKHGDADIALMLGGNWQRVLGAIWGRRQSGRPVA
jgi:membrane dipeptidase